MSKVKEWLYDEVEGQIDKRRSRLINRRKRQIFEQEIQGFNCKFNQRGI